MCRGQEQRERTGKLKLKDISMHFHLPIQEAARRMSLCPTVVKKICRRGGLYRWPHRKVIFLKQTTNHALILLNDSSLFFLIYLYESCK